MRREMGVLRVKAGGAGGGVESKDSTEEARGPGTMSHVDSSESI